jgi:hypothetical protein
MAKQASNSGPLAPEGLYTRQEVAAWLKVRPRQLTRMGVPCLDLGRKTKRYLGGDVLAWLEHMQRHHAQADSRSTTTMEELCEEMAGSSGPRH